MNKTANLENAMRKNANLLNLVSRLNLSFTDHETGETLNTRNDYEILFSNSKKQNQMAKGKFSNKNTGKAAEPAKPAKPEEKKEEKKVYAPPPGYDAPIESKVKRNFYKFGESGDSLECILIDIEEIDFGKGEVETAVIEVNEVGEMLLPTHVDLLGKCEAALEKYGSPVQVSILYEGKIKLDNGNTIARYQVFPQKKS